MRGFNPKDRLLTTESNAAVSRACSLKALCCVSKAKGPISLLLLLIVLLLLPDDDEDDFIEGALWHSDVVAFTVCFSGEGTNLSFSCRRSRA